MIIGIGTDLVQISRIDEMLEKHGDRIAQRILSEAEFAEFKLQIKPASFLAKRFAAKEAASKALGTGFRNGLSLRHISVKHNSEGKPELHFEAVGETLKQKLKVGKTFLSLSDEQEYALAYVILTDE